MASCENHAPGGRGGAGAEPEGLEIQVVPIPQLVNAGEVGQPALLPSFLYLPGQLDFPEGAIRLPWDDRPAFVVGELARKRGAENPGRLVSSAKSWLSYPGADRTAPILPWGAPDEVPRISPLDASAEYLRHLARAWNVAAGDDEAVALERQEIILTVPASFDEAARELTLSAAARAGLEAVTLLEEPQAAFYAWIDAQGEPWRRRVKAGDLVLVCDIGGGTTDFSLILIGEEDGALSLERVAVGDHILLGGDNMDLALARTVQQRLEAAGHKVDRWQLHALWHQSRIAKEHLLSRPDLRSCPVTLVGKGTRLVGGTIKAELTRADVDEALLEAFFPQVSSSDIPSRPRRVGFQELGLPYAADVAVTRHLARFLRRQAAGGPSAGKIRRGPSGLACPTHVLFNGGVMKARALGERVVQVLDRWLEEEGFGPISSSHVLEARDMDHAVARGAAYYGRARRGRGIRIRSGAPRSYYVGVESAMPAVPGMPAPLKALAVVPFGMEEGTRAAIPDREFGLVVGEPVEFRFLSSTVRKGDPPGTLLEDWEEDLEELTPLEVTLDGSEGQVVPVTLESHVTEVGTMELWCVSRQGDARWKLELNIRETEPDGMS
ncbi:MAG: Hsp70 family protein [Vicinamibacterales bacterium]